MYVITKRSRVPSYRSYSGPTWDAAGVRHLYKQWYASEEEANKIAETLNEYNPVGFRVDKAKSRVFYEMLWLLSRGKVNIAATSGEIDGVSWRLFEDEPVRVVFFNGEETVTFYNVKKLREWITS